MFDRQLDQPLYPKVLWSRPISRATAGRLLIVGGQGQSFAALQAGHQAAQAAGIGDIQIVAPETLRPLIGRIISAHFAPATSSGSLAKAALGGLIEAGSYSDGCLLGLDLSNNSETAIVIEQFIDKYHGHLILVADALEQIAFNPDSIRSRPHTLVVLTMQQLFRMAGRLQLPLMIQPETGVGAKVEIVRQLQEVLRVDLALIGPEIIICASDRTSVTATVSQPPPLLVAACGVLSVLYIQNPNQAYEGLTTAAYVLNQAAQLEGEPTQPAFCQAITTAIAQAETGH